MALPMFLMAAGMGLQTAGGLYSIGVKQQLYRAQARAYEADAETSEQATALDVERYRKTAESALSSMRASYAKSGVELSSGSPLEVMAESAGQAELDAKIIQWQGDVQAINLRNQARMTRYQARNSFVSDLLGLGGSLLAQGGNMALSGKSFTGTTASAPKGPTHLGAGGTTAYGM